MTLPLTLMLRRESETIHHHNYKACNVAMALHSQLQIHTAQYGQTDTELAGVLLAVYVMTEAKMNLVLTSNACILPMMFWTRHQTTCPRIC